MNKHNANLRYFLLVVLTVMVVIFCQSLYASELPQPGNRYEIIRTIYLDAWYYSLSYKKTPISKKTASAWLHAVHSADRVWHAFRTEVPAGTIMTIIGPAPRRWHLRLLYPNAKRYYVRLKPDLSRELDVEIELNGGMEGSLDGLNPDFFRSLQEK